MSTAALVPYSAEIGGLTGICTVLLCVVITFANGDWIGGIAYPYFSETFPEGARQIIAIIGLIVTGFFIVIATAAISENNKQRISDDPGGCGGLTTNTVSRWLVFGATIFMVCVPLFSTWTMPLIHLLAAILFFVLMLAYVICNMRVTAKMAAAGDEIAKSVLTAKKILCGFLALFFTIYLPIGLAIVCDFLRLTYAECLQEYDAEFCNTYRKEDDPTLTVLFNYTGCSGINVLRAVTQHLSVLCILLYVFVLGREIRAHKAAGGGGGGADVEAGAA